MKKLRGLRKKGIAWLLAMVMVLSLLVNVGYNAIAEGDVYTLTDTTITVYTYVNGVETTITSDTVLENGDNIKVLLNWEVANTEGNTITANTDIQYNLGCAGVVISNSSGSVLQNGIAVGTYYIDESGVLHMTITDSTLLSKSDITGGLSIDAVIDTSGLPEDENGQSTVSIGSQTIKVQVTNPDTLPSVSKSRSGNMYMGDDGKYYQNFQVVVTDNSNASSITFTDTFGGYLSYVSGSMYLDGSTAVTPTDNGDGTISYTINNPVKGQQYVLTYTAEVSEKAFANDYWYSSNDRAYYNTATVTNSNGNSATSDTFSLGYKNWISKWGSYDANTDSIFWCITVNAGDEISILNTNVKDTLPEGVEITGNVIVKDSNGQQVAIKSAQEFLADGVNFTEYTSYNNGLKSGQFTIEYTTKITDASAGLANTAFTNEATVTNTTYGVDKTTTATVNVKNDWLKKTYAMVDTTNSVITWQAVITIPESQTEAERITFTDTFGAGLEYVDGSYSATYDNSISTSDSVTVNNGTFNAIFSGVKYESGKSNKIIITYQTKYTVDEDATQQDFVNTATLTDEDGNTETDTATYRYTNSSINIVPYKWHTGSSGTTSSWGLQVNGANNLYDEVVAGERVYIYDTPTITTTDGTAIAAGFSVVPGSIKVSGNTTDLITATLADDGKTIIFDITEYIKNNQYNCYYFELHYTIALDDETVRYMLENDINQVNMSNQVNAYLYNSDGTKDEDIGSTVGNGTGTPSIGTLLTKSYTYDSTTAPYANYVIDINPQALDLIEGNGTLSLKDEMGHSLQIDLSTVKLVAKDSDGNATEVVGTTTAFNSSTNTLTINNIPDATHCVLSYAVRVNVDYEDGSTFESQTGIDVGNACELYANSETYSSSEVKLTGTVQKSSAWADSDYGSIILSKHSGLTVLGGAKFNVTAYKIDENGSLVVNTNYATEYATKGVTIGEIETESDGKKTVNLLFDILYCIQETQAPDGYKTSADPIYIIIPGKDYNEAQVGDITVADAVAAFETANNVTVNELSSGETYYVENEELSQYSAQIIKSDQDGNYVAGATFELLKDDGTGTYVAALDSNNVAITGTTDSNGRITFNYLEAGNYKINETSVPEGYVMTSTSTQEFVLSDTSKSAILYVENEKLYGTWTITKYQMGAAKTLQGVTLGLYKDGSDTAIKTAVTNADGQVVFEDLELGVTYKVKEIATIDGYILNSSTVLEFTPTGTTSATLDGVGSIDNEKEAGKIRITKTVTGSTTPVEGAVYTLYDSNQNIIYDANNKPVTATTDATGIAIFTDLEFDTYYVRETEAPEGYELDTTLYQLTVNSNTGYSDLTHTNDEQVNISPFMSFKFKKNGYDENGNSTGGLAGAVFELRQGTTVVDTAVSDADGWVYFLNVTTTDDSGAFYGYNISEASAPTGYVTATQGIYISADKMSAYYHNAEYTSANKSLVVELSGDVAGDETSYYFDNYKAAGKVVLTKTDEYKTTTLPGARYAAYKNGSDTPSAVATSGDNGLLTFTGLEYGATYVFREIQAPEGYTISSDTIQVTIGVDTPTSMEGNNNIFVYENITSAPDAYTVTDTPIELNISKQSITGTSEVHGAKLTLKDAQGNVIDSWTSTTTAHAISASSLKVNTVYTLTETSAPDGYGYSEEISFKIAEDGSIEILTGSDANATVDNENHIVVMKDKAIGFSLGKVDATTGSRLTGATLQLLDSNESVLNEWTSSNSGDYTIDATVAENIGLKVPSTNGQYTEYIFRETKAPSGYYAAADIHFYIDYTGNVYLKNDAGNYVAVQDNRIVMKDIAFSDDVVISKVAITGGAELPGATLTVIDKSNSDAVVDTWTSTDTAHTIDISKFVNGHTYELVETGAPTGYAYAESIQFTINDDGQVVINGNVQDGNMVVMTDTAISVTLNKKDEDGNAIPGAVITLSEKNDGKVTEITTTASAQDIGSYLKAGSEYKLHESTVPFGYKIADDVYFKIDDNGDLYTSNDLGTTYSKAASNVITMLDKFETITVSKYDMTNSKEIDGAKLKITKASDDSYVTDWTSSYAGGPQELNVAELFEANVVYKLTETTAPYGYELAESIEFKFDENSVLYVKNAGDADFAAVDDDEIVMEDKVSVIYINKVDATNGDELPGAHLVIKNSAGAVVDEWDSTDTKHQIEVVGNFVANAEYTLTETIAPDGYDIAETITFRITSAGVVQVKSGSTWTDVTDDTVVMEDNVKSAYFSKVDATNSEEIAGAELVITDGAGKEIASWTSGTTKHSIPMTDLNEDVDYTLTEITAPFGYKVAESIKFKIVDGEVYVKDGETGFYVETTSNTVVMEDAPLYFSISKVDITSKEELPGASLKITDAAGNEIDSWTSSTVVHKVKMADLTPGAEYTLTETTAPKGYEIAESIIFRVNADGTVSVKNGDSWTVMTDGVVVMEDEVSTTETTETTETTATTTETTATTTETTVTTTETNESGGLDDPSDGSGTPGIPSTSTTETSTSTDTSSSDTNVKTGDSAPINMVFLLMVMSGIGMLIFGSKRKKRSED